MKDSKKRCVVQSGAINPTAVIVGEDPAEQSVASSARFATAFHPLHVFHVLQTMR